MKKVLLRLGELICVVLLGVIIAYVCVQDSVSQTPFETVESAVVAAADTEGLKARDALEIKKKLSLEGDAYTDFVCLSSDSVMDVRELMLFKATDANAVRALSERLEQYADEKTEIFEGYAPEESSMLSAHLLIGKKGYVLFYIGESKEAVASAFNGSL